MASRALEGLHILLIPTWYPTPEAPTGGRLFKEYIQSFTGAGARVGLLYPDLVDLGNLPKRAREPGYLARVGEMGLPPSPAPLLREEEMAGAPVVRVRGMHSSFGRKERRIDRYAIWLRRAYRHYVSRHGVPNVLNPHCAVPAGWAALRLAESLEPRPRVVLTEHTGPFRLLLPQDSPAIAERTLAACREADAVCAVGSVLRAEMQEAGVTQPITIIPNPVAADFSFTEMPAPERGANGRPRFAAVYSGRYSKLKGIPELAEAMRRIAREPDLEVRWEFFGFAELGEKEEEERLRRVLSSGKVSGTLHGIRTRAEIAEVMRASHFLVLPSHRDNCPLAIVEALSMGRPVAGTRGTGIEYFVEPGDGLLSKPNDADDWTRTLLDLLRNFSRWDARAIAERARGRFGWEAVAEQYAPLLRG